MSLGFNDVAAIFFDFGDTLVTLPIPREELFVQAARSIGLQLNIAVVRRAFQTVDFNNKYSSISVRSRTLFYQQFNERMCEALGISSHLQQLLPAVSDEFSRNRGWIPVADAEKVLTALRARQARMAIVANWDSNLSDVANRLGLRDFFSAVVASHGVGVEKPNPEIFKFALDELSLTNSPEKVLYVGNEYKADVLGARAAGLLPVLIDRNNEYEHADCLRFGSLSEWLEHSLNVR